ncbi:T4SS-associated protein LvhB7 [Legionella saoudiensis]|uniref:T4SS-associated protein LvhB7 n=1 Tax=Legionella saoudiensis TaxID=1750561 RepID=UPI000A6B5220|nr:T4SS-associated protein LvhB7 [Legionella saoudiensis]
MKKIMQITVLFVIASLAVACSKTHELRAPCPDFGRYCAQTPINSINKVNHLN